MTDMPEEIYAFPYGDMGHGEWDSSKWKPCPFVENDKPPKHETSYTRTDIHEALQAKCERYERALRFYADRDHVETHGHNLPTYDASSDQDYVENGERAREALNHKESQ